MLNYRGSFILLHQQHCSSEYGAMRASHFEEGGNLMLIRSDMRQNSTFGVGEVLVSELLKIGKPREDKQWEINQTEWMSQWKFKLYLYQSPDALALEPPTFSSAIMLGFLKSFILSYFIPIFQSPWLW